MAVEFRDRGPSPFGNNFGLLFWALKLREQGSLHLPDFQPRIDKAERVGGRAWGRFLSQNEALLQDIFTAFDENSAYYEAIDRYSVLFAEGRMSEAKASKDSLKELEDATYNRLNPLLEEAAEKLEELSINWREFTV